ncbi:hypothetical protein [Glutamicibacter soli]
MPDSAASRQAPSTSPLPQRLAQVQDIGHGVVHRAVVGALGQRLDVDGDHHLLGAEFGVCGRHVAGFASGAGRAHDTQLQGGVLRRRGLSPSSDQFALGSSAGTSAAEHPEDNSAARRIPAAPLALREAVMRPCY